MKRKSNILYLSSNEKNVEKKVSTELEEKGVVVVENFITQKQCDELMMLFKEKQLENSNELTFVHVKDAKFFSNALGSSKAAFDLVTSKLARKIAESYLGKNFRLKCHRAYELNKSYHFPWHTDNKYDKKKNEESGIVLIVYLSDTKEGATEFILGSHKFSNNFSKNNYSKAYIKDNYSDLLAKANGKAGSAVISDIRVIHRGGLGMKKINLVIVLLSISSSVFAYIGPGIGGGIIAGVLGVIGAVLLALFGILYYPIKRMLKNRKK